MPKQVQHDGGPLNAYVRNMHPLHGILLMIGVVAAMEVVAYAVHRWVMHGPGWFLHKSHHQPSGPLEANDLYGLIFAIPSVLLIFGGMNLGGRPGLPGSAAGLRAYGPHLFRLHDVIVHKRIAHRFVPRSTYFKRIVQAHRLHHAVDSREGAVSFGFIWAPRPEALKPSSTSSGCGRPPSGRELLRMARPRHNAGAGGHDYPVYHRRDRGYSQWHCSAAARFGAPAFAYSRATTRRTAGGKCARNGP
jgi:beta-carotene 3-hydroxylase